jgi:hypothetical protein
LEANGQKEGEREREREKLPTFLNSAGLAQCHAETGGSNPGAGVPEPARFPVPCLSAEEFEPTALPKNRPATKKGAKKGTKN